MDIDDIRQNNISKEMLRIGISPDFVELSKNGLGFRAVGTLTEKQKKHIEDFTANQYTVYQSCVEAMKDKYGTWAEMERQTKTRDQHKKLKTMIRNVKGILDLYDLKQWVINK
jgi:hypothetical protein